jgi:hypothetical protein
MLEAIYGVEFISNQMAPGYGVVTLEKGRILGGDTAFVYVGNYEIIKDRIHATIMCTNDHEVLPSVFGQLKEFNLKLQGEPNNTELVLKGHMVEHPELSIGLKLTRRAELP